MIAGLDLPGRAALLGISAREYVQIGDARIVAAPALSTAGAVARLRRWLEAGRPTADLARLDFAGADAVGAIVVEVIAALPAPVAWHAIEFVTWIEVGRGTAGWCGLAPAARAPSGDQAHRISINGRANDLELRSTIPHEIGHSWVRDIVEAAPMHTALPHREAIALRILFERRRTGGGAAVQQTDAAERWIRARIAEELMADSVAEAWGFFPNGPSALDHHRYFAAEYRAAAALTTKGSP